MSGIPKSSANPKKCKKIPSAGGDLPLVLPGGQSVLVAANGRLADVVVRLPQVVHGLPLQGGLIIEQICRGVPEVCSLANFVLQYAAQSDLGRSTVRFATEIEQTSEKARLWRGTRKAWPRLFYV